MNAYAIESTKKSCTFPCTPDFLISLHNRTLLHTISISQQVLIV